MKLTVDAKKFRPMVQAAKKIVRKNLIYDNDQMNYIRCVVTNNILTMYACDGHKIMKDKIVVYSDCDFCFYMRAEIPPLHGKDPLMIEIVEGYIMLQLMILFIKHFNLPLASHMVLISILELMMKYLL